MSNCSRGTFRSSSRSLVLAVFRQPVAMRPTAVSCTTRTGAHLGACIAIFLLQSDVPLPADEPAQPGRGGSTPTTLMGFSPSQFSSCLQVARRSRLPEPTCRCPKRPSRWFFVGRSAIACFCCPVPTGSTANHGRSESAPGLCPCRQAAPLPLGEAGNGRSCLGLGLFQVFRHPPMDVFRQRWTAA